MAVALKLKRPPRNPSKISRDKLKRRLRKIYKARYRKKNPSLNKKQKAQKHEELRLLGERPPLRQTQIEGIEFLKKANYNAIIADSMGTGKTALALVALAQNASKLLPCLVVCPSSVVWNWRRETYFWVRSSVECTVVEGMQSEIKTGSHFIIVSWDLLHYRLEELKKIRFRCLIADEAHYAKNPLSMRSQAVGSLEIPHKILMTGTPLINEISELKVLRSLIGTEEAPILRRLLKDVAPEIPPKKRVMLPVEMTPQLKIEYQEAAEEFEEWLGMYLNKVFGNQPAKVADRLQRSINQENLVKISYLRRICGRGKIAACGHWAYKMVKKGESIVIFAEHHDVQDLLCETLRKLSIGHVRIDGSSGRVERQLAIDNFQNGAIKVFIGSRAAIEGITLTRARHLAFLELYFTPSAMEQAEDRIRRIGQTQPTTIWYLIAKNTFDERIIEIINRKRKVIHNAIGSEEISLLEIEQEYAGWKNITALHKIEKKLKEHPNVSAPLPPLPHPKFVRGIFFGVESWSIPQVLKSIRSRGYKMLEMKSKEGRVFISTRVPQQFDRKTIRWVQVAQDLTVVVGKPVNSNAERMRNYRK